LIVAMDLSRKQKCSLYLDYLLMTELLLR